MSLPSIAPSSRLGAKVGRYLFAQPPFPRPMPRSTPISCALHLQRRVSRPPSAAVVAHAVGQAWPLVERARAASAQCLLAFLSATRVDKIGLPAPLKAYSSNKYEIGFLDNFMQISGLTDRLRCLSSVLPHLYLG